jgi:DNA-binding transcriptional LysR family regulator
MAKIVDWDSRIGRRVRLRDLHILFAVVQHGSMAKAGVHLGMSQSAVSQAIASIEHTLDVRLLDRTSRGVEPTIFGTALLRRGRAVFDELRLGVKEIECLADPAAGEVRIACPEWPGAGFLSPIIDHLSLRYPRVTAHVHVLGGSAYGQYPELLERRVDASLVLLPQPFDGELAREFDAEFLCYDEICLAAGSRSRWSSRRKIDLAELGDEPFILPDAELTGATAVMGAFRARGLPPPRIAVTTVSVHLRNFLGMSGRFIVALPVSILNLYGDLFRLKRLPIELPNAQLPVGIITLKNRTLSPTAELFIACAREVTKSMAAAPPRAKRVGLAGKSNHSERNARRASVRVRLGHSDTDPA